MVYLDYMKSGKMKDIISYYRSRLFIVDKQVLVADANHSYVATVTGINEPRALIVKDGYGTVQHITTGEIKLNWGNQR